MISKITSFFSIYFVLFFESIRLFVPTGASVQVLDNNGRLVFNQSNITSGLEINTQDWTTGMYFVHMNFGGLNLTEKLIIE
jgi:hypothetical protein